MNVIPNRFILNLDLIQVLSPLLALSTQEATIMCRNITVSRHKWNDHGGNAEQKDVPNKRSFFPVFNEERGHLVHKLRDHDDNVVEEKHERGTSLQRLWPLPQTAQCKQLPLFPFISVFTKHLLQRTLPRCRGPRL